MPRRIDLQNPIDRRQKALEEQSANLKAQLEKVKRFQEKAPELKAEARKREQQEIFSTYRRPVRVEGPADFRYELVPSKAGKKPRKLRKERSKAPMLTLVLLVTFCCVVAYAVRTLWHG
jgi:sugar-specific transcriptional regulator TrmB